jgi:hypothetical protein
VVKIFFNSFELILTCGDRKVLAAQAKMSEFHVGVAVSVSIGFCFLMAKL